MPNRRLEMAEVQTKPLSIVELKAKAKAADAVLEQMFAYYDRVATNGDDTTGRNIRRAA